MGNCAENTAAKLKITREDQDDFCLSSYTRAQEAWAADAFADEIAPVTVKGRKGDVVVKEDEDYKKLLKDKFRTIRPVFVKENGTVTAANASTLNDGASAVVLASGEVVEKEGLKPLAKILGMSPSPSPSPSPLFLGIVNTKSNLIITGQASPTPLVPLSTSPPPLPSPCPLPLRTPACQRTRLPSGNSTRPFPWWVSRPKGCSVWTGPRSTSRAAPSLSATYVFFFLLFFLFFSFGGSH